MTLPLLSTTLVKELETKISEAELTTHREKDPLSTKEIKVGMKQDRYKIKFLIECFPAYSAKRPTEKSGSLDSDTGTKCQDRRASRSTSKGNIEGNVQH